MTESIWSNDFMLILKGEGTTSSSVFDGSSFRFWTLTWVNSVSYSTSQVDYVLNKLLTKKKIVLNLKMLNKIHRLLLLLFLLLSDRQDSKQVCLVSYECSYYKEKGYWVLIYWIFNLVNISATMNLDISFTSTITTTLDIVEHKLGLI